MRCRLADVADDLRDKVDVDDDLRDDDVRDDNGAMVAVVVRSVGEREMGNVQELIRSRCIDRYKSNKA